MIRPRLMRRDELRLLAALFIVLLAAGCGERASFEELMAEARQQHEKGNHSAAIIQLRNAVQKSPENPQGPYLLGVIYLRIGNARSAEEEFRRALGLGADPRQAVPELAKSLLLQGRIKEALNETDPARVPQARDSAEILNARGLAQLAAGMLPEARRTLDQALTLRPDLADVVLTQARLAVAERAWNRAEVLVDRALEISPSSEEGWRFKGELQRMLGRPDQAIAAYAKAVEANPRSTAARLDFAAVQIAAGRLEEAALQLEAVRKVAPANTVAAYLRALLAFRRKDYDAALASVQDALKEAPRYLPGLLLAGAAEYARGNLDQAEGHLNTALGQAPGNVYARKLLAAIQMKNQQHALAIRTLTPAVATGVPDPDLYALAGEAYLQNNQYTRATRFFELAASIDRKNPSWRAGAVLSQMAAGETERAIAELDAAAALDSDGYRTGMLLVMLYIKRGDFDRALNAIDKLSERKPPNPLFENLKGAALLGKRDTAQARARFEAALKLEPTYFPATANLAQLDFAEGNLPAARRRFEALLERDRDHMEAMLGLADLAARASGREQEVLEWISRAKRARPGAPDPIAMEAGYYLRTGQAERALAAAQELQVRRPNNPEALDVLGQALLASGQRNEALQAYSTLASLQPESALPLYRLATAQMATQRSAAAEMSLRKALELRPDYRDAQVALATVNLEQGRNRESLQIAKQIQREAPADPAGYLLEGDVLAAQKEGPRALALYEKAYQLGKSGLAAMKIHHAWGLMGKPEQGETRITEWIRENPGDSVARRYLADDGMRRGKYAAAIAHYRVMLEQQPGNVVALHNLAWALHSAKDPQALPYAEQAYRLSPNDPLIADTLGWILVERGEVRRGLELLRIAAGAATSNPEIGYHLAQALVKAGDTAEAIRQLERIPAAGPEFPERAALLRRLRGR